GWNVGGREGWGEVGSVGVAVREVVGVADTRRLPLIAGALRELETVHALVVHGEPGLDEISPLGPTHVLEIRDGDLREWTIDPTRYEFGAARAEHLAGGTPKENADMVIRVLAGEGSTGATAAVVLNAAAALYVAGGRRSFDEAVDQADAALKEGYGLRALQRLREAFSRRPAADSTERSRASIAPQYSRHDPLDRGVRFGD